MFLQIEDSMTIEEVQDRFSECFPFLSIAFYSTSQKRFQPGDKRFQYDSQERIENIRQNHNRGALEIKSWYSVAKVEKDLREIYGLYAQVFRNMQNGDIVQTVQGDHLTLREQSNLACDPSFYKEDRGAA